MAKNASAKAEPATPAASESTPPASPAAAAPAASAETKSAKKSKSADDGFAELVAEKIRAGLTKAQAEQVARDQLAHDAALAAGN